MRISRPRDVRIAMRVCLVALVLADGCAAHVSAGLHGHYKSKDDAGVLVFREDGTFGYQFAAMFDFYTEDELPPHRGRYRFVDNTRVELFDLPAGTPAFTLETHDRGKMLILKRTQPDGTLPEVAIYHKQ